MKAKELIKQLLEHDLDYEVIVAEDDAYTNGWPPVDNIGVNDTQKEIYINIGF